MLLEFSPSSFQSLQEYPKLREALLPSLDVISFQSLQEYPKRLTSSAVQSLYLVSNPYRNILSDDASDGLGVWIGVSNPYRNILSDMLRQVERPPEYVSNPYRNILSEFRVRLAPGIYLFPILTGIS